MVIYMKKILVIGIILVLSGMISTPIISASNNPESGSKVERNYQPLLTVEFKGSSIVITNIGDKPANNVAVQVSFEGLIFIGKDSTNSIGTIMPGEEYTSALGFVFGIGPVTIHVEVTYDDMLEPATAQATGFMLGPLLLGLS